MANIGEPHSARLARERLEAIKKYIPLRDGVKQKLQSRQESQVEFEEDTKQLFKPVTETTKGIQPLLEKTAEATGKIAERTKKTKKILRELPAEIAAAQPIREIFEGIERVRDEIVDIKDRTQEPEEEQARGRVDMIDKFTEDAIIEIKRVENVGELAKVAVDSYNDRKRFLKLEYADRAVSRDTWFKWIFRIYYEVDQVKKDDPNYPSYVDALSDYNLFIQSPPEEAAIPKRKYTERAQPAPEITLDLPTPLPPSPSKEREEEKKDIFRLSGLFEKEEPPTGSGFTNQGGDLTPCPNNVLADVERLEILIGGKRAGNNSPEIINEVADICKRLFTGGIMDINVYRSLINEIADDYYSD